jgi:Fuc2NAc and GlcNAc transferase
MMSTYILFALALLVLMCTWAGVGWVRRYALRRLVDTPNERSSHSVPTPRGGGLAVSVVYLASVLVAWVFGLLSGEVAAAVVGGGLAVAGIGFLDDHRSVSATVRLIVHALAVFFGLHCLGNQMTVDMGWGNVEMVGGWQVLLILGVVWFLNLFNFMDGIDGIAGSQAVFMAALAALLLASNPDASAKVPFILLACAALGFLIWNWPPARIFMGDVGSGFLGYVIGMLAIWTMTRGWLSLWVWVIMGGTFLADATVTLLVRSLAGVHITVAHRSHVYQRLARRWGSHGRVSLLYLAINLLWLAPCAFLAHRHPHRGALLAVLAVLPLCVIAYALGAGHQDQSKPE